jgi:hypothetical protein
MLKNPGKNGRTLETPRSAGQSAECFSLKRAFAASKGLPSFLFPGRKSQRTRADQAKPDDTTRIKAEIFLQEQQLVYMYVQRTCFTPAETDLCF